MARKVAALVCKCDHSTDLKKVAVGQSPIQLGGGPFFDEDGMRAAVVVDIKHNESGLAGVYKNRMSAVYRVELENGVEFVVPADNVRIVILTGGEQVGG